MWREQSVRLFRACLRLHTLFRPQDSKKRVVFVCSELETGERGSAARMKIPPDYKKFSSRVKKQCATCVHSKNRQPKRALWADGNPPLVLAAFRPIQQIPINNGLFILEWMYVKTNVYDCGRLSHQQTLDFHII